MGEVFICKKGLFKIIVISNIEKRCLFEWVSFLKSIDTILRMT